jgi:hypothetical protein
LDTKTAFGDTSKSRATIGVEDVDEDEDELRHDDEIIELSDDEENKENQVSRLTSISSSIECNFFVSCRWNLSRPFHLWIGRQVHCSIRRMYHHQ